MRLVSVFVFGFLLTAFTPLSAGNEERIAWGSKQITWNDFKGKSRSHTGIAGINSQIDIEIGTVDHNKVNVSVLAVFVTTASWHRWGGNEILAHELRHFDITELYARKLRKALKELVCDKENYRDKINELYERTVKELDDTQDQYDEETEHSMNGSEQRRWNMGIKAAIEELDAYQSASAEVKVEGN